jgi:Transposase IS200 like
MKNQTDIFEHFESKSTKKRYARKAHGGDLAKGKRKLERPLSTKNWIHLVLKSDKARGRMSFLTPAHKIFISKLIQAKARRFGIKVADFANVGNHLHLKIKTSSRLNFQKFLKSITALIARYITGARRGKPFGPFWQALAFTRVLTSRRENTVLAGYMAANREESQGGKGARENFLAHFYDWAEHRKPADDSLNSEHAFLMYANSQ